MSTSVTGSAAGYISNLYHQVRSCVCILLVSIIYMAYMIRSHNYTITYIMSLFLLSLLFSELNCY
jgi:hypothetical protein